MPHKVQHSIACILQGIAGSHDQSMLYLMRHIIERRKMVIEGSTLYCVEVRYKRNKKLSFVSCFLHKTKEAAEKAAQESQDHLEESVDGETHLYYKVSPMFIVK